MMSCHNSEQINAPVYVIAISSILKEMKCIIHKLHYTVVLMTMKIVIIVFFIVNLLNSSDT